MRVILPAAIAALSFAVAVPDALAQQRRPAPAAKAQPQSVAAEDDDEAGLDEARKVDTEDTFGFARGSAVTSVGERELQFEQNAGFGRRRGRFANGTSVLSYEFGAADRLSVAIKTGAAFQRSRNVPGVQNLSAGGFDGGAVEFRYSFLDAATNPFGVALSIQPGLGLFSPTSGPNLPRAELDASLAIERRIAGDNLRGVVNIGYSGGAGKAKDVDPLTPPVVVSRMERVSQANLSGALSLKVAPRAYLGGEVAHLRSYGDMSLGQLQGFATFVGPSAYVKFDRISVSAAWSTQVAGQAKGEIGKLDLRNFSRHRGKIGLVLDF
jgi:hypothetical protein